MTQSISVSNRFSYLSSVCAECESRTCICITNSQYNDVENSKSSRQDDSFQILDIQNDDNSMSFSVSEDSNVINVSNVDASMRPSHADKNNDMFAFSNLNDSSDVSFNPTTQDTYVDNQSHAEYTDGVISSTNHSSENSSQVSENTATQNQVSTSKHNQSTLSYLLDLGLTCKGFRMGHINIQQ